MNEDKVSNREKYFWNMMGSLCNAFSTVILLLLVNWILGKEMGGLFSLACANAQMMLIIGGFEVRPIQTTDVDGEYSFQTYFTTRIISCVLMMCVCIVYSFFSGFRGEKLWVVIAFAAFKMVEAFTDVFGGMYQQYDRIDLTGKTFSVRVVFSTIIFGVALLCTHSLLAGAIAMVVVSFFLFFLYDIHFVMLFPNIKIGISFQRMDALIRDVFPLFIAAFIMSYISNAPKYAIDVFCSDILQNKYSILFMPAFVVNLFSIFVFRPVLVDMTKRWNQHDIAGLMRYIKKSVFFIIAMTIVCIVGGILVGIPVLSIIYRVDLSTDKLVLIVVMIYGGFSAFNTYFYYVITVMRAQNKILIGYITAFLVVLILSPILVRKLQLMGAAMCSAIGSMILDIIFVIIIVISIKNVKK